MNSKKYLILYYICCAIMFVLTPGLISMLKIDIDLFDFFFVYSLKATVIIINLLLFIVFTVFVMKKKIEEKSDLLFPISFIVFYIIVLGLCFLFNDKVVIEYYHFSYFLKFVVLYFTVFNIYSVLCIDFKKKKTKANRK